MEASYISERTSAPSENVLRKQLLNGDLYSSPLAGNPPMLVRQQLQSKQNNDLTKTSPKQTRVVGKHEAEQNTEAVREEHPQVREALHPHQPGGTS